MTSTNDRFVQREIPIHYVSIIDRLVTAKIVVSCQVHHFDALILAK